jgi:ubiquinone biosynthesis monooxygenase Coq7
MALSGVLKLQAMDNLTRAINPFANNPVDQLIVGFDKALRVVGGVAKAARANPGTLASDCELNNQEARHSAGLMRVNHVGEVCAQALYDAQGKHASTPAMRAQMAESGREEEDHLAWTAERLSELGSQPSLLNPLWYAGAYALGSVAARMGDAVSLGFVVETERQVARHRHPDARRRDRARRQGAGDGGGRDAAAGENGDAGDGQGHDHHRVLHLISPRRSRRSA